MRTQLDQQAHKSIHQKNRLRVEPNPTVAEFLRFQRQAFKQHIKT